jgi:hypothetical protein
LRLAGILGEVVGCDEASGYAFVETRPSVVGGIYDGVLEASRVLEVEVELAVLATVYVKMLVSFFFQSHMNLDLPAGVVPGPM